MAKKDKKLMAISAVGLVALVVVLVWQLRPRNSPSAAAATPAEPTVSLRSAWRAMGHSLQSPAGSQGSESPVADVEMPGRNPFMVSELLRDQFGRKAVEPPTQTRPAAADPHDPEQQKRLQREAMLKKMAERIRYFQKTYKPAAILDGLAMIRDQAVKVGDRIEECAVTAIGPKSVTLKGTLGGDELSTVECTTFEVAGRPAASVQGTILRLGDKFKGCTVVEIGEGRIVLKQDGAPGASEADRLEFTVNLTLD